jgi:gamma-glutamyltranspeptidase
VAADGSGLAISLIQSLFDGFGSGILEPATGIVLHNRGACFTLDPTHPNHVAGGKRPAHSLMPVVVQRRGELVALAGTMGGGAQPQINAMTLLRALDLGLTPDVAVAGPRWLVGGMALGTTQRRVVAESSVPTAVRDAVAGVGYGIDLVGAVSEDVGHAHLVLATDGALQAGCDPRSDGEADAR